MLNILMTLLVSGTILSEVAANTVPAEKYIWNWRDAIVLKAMTDIYENEPQQRPYIIAWIKSAMDANLGHIHGNHPNGVASGTGMAFLAGTDYDYDGIYAEASRKIYEQYVRIKRTDGATSHRPSRIELWDDTVYMLTIYLLQMYRTTGDYTYLEDCIREVISHAKRLGDKKTGMWWHGWSVSSYYYDDSCCEYMWNSNNLQRNTEFWGRGNGWIAMALADLLSVMDRTDNRYQTILGYYRHMMETLCKVQDNRTGHWRQLPLRYKEAELGNYIESSCTAMFGYAMSKGVNNGFLKGLKFQKCMLKALKGLTEYSIIWLGENDISMSNICEGTCIGEREYYYSRGTVSDESFAIGALLMFWNQANIYERYRNHRFSDKYTK